MLRPIFVKDYFAVTKFDRHGVRQGSSVIKYRGWRYAFFRQRQMFDGDDLQIRQHQRFIVDRQVCHEKLQLSSISKSWEASDWSKKSIRGLTCGSIWLLTTWVRRRWHGYLVGPTKYYDKLDPQYSDRWDPQNSDKWDQVVADIWVPIMLTGGTHKFWQVGPEIGATWFHLIVTLWHFPSPFEFDKIWEHLNYLRNLGNKKTGEISKSRQ
jgi:hypothetical protein